MLPSPAGRRQPSNVSPYECHPVIKEAYPWEKTICLHQRVAPCGSSWSLLSSLWPSLFCAWSGSSSIGRHPCSTRVLVAEQPSLESPGCPLSSVPGLRLSLPAEVRGQRAPASASGFRCWASLFWFLEDFWLLEAVFTSRLSGCWDSSSCSPQPSFRGEPGRLSPRL